MSAQFIYTYSDAIDHCDRFLKRRGVAKEGANDQGDIREAIALAYREVPGRRPWSYYRRQTRIPLVAPYSTGTVSFDYSGGVFERQLTLTSGTWPEWAAYGEVIINSVFYRVEDRKSSTVLTLDPKLNPGADVASGTSYSLVRDCYTLPNNFVSMGNPTVASSYGWLSYVSPDAWLEQRANGSGTPGIYTIMGDPSVIGNLAFYVQPYAAAAQNLDLIYHARPRPMIEAGYLPDECKGYVTTTADSITVTGHDTAFAASMEGSILRISKNATQPARGLASHTVRVDERTVMAVANATTLSVDAGVNTTLSKVKYSISDPVDIEPGMLGLFLACCEYHVACICDLPKPERYQQRYDAAYILACEQDSRVHAMRGVGQDFAVIPGYTVEASL